MVEQKKPVKNLSRTMNAFGFCWLGQLISHKYNQKTSRYQQLIFHIFHALFILRPPLICVNLMEKICPWTEQIFPLTKIIFRFRNRHSEERPQKQCQISAGKPHDHPHPAVKAEGGNSSEISANITSKCDPRSISH